MKTIIAGGRYIHDYNLLLKAVKNCGWTITTVVSGCAPGADAMGERFARENGIPIDRHPANWLVFGKAAGPIRNEEMASSAEALIAIHDGVSTGTADMIKKAKKRGLKIHVEPCSQPKRTK